MYTFVNPARYHTYVFSSHANCCRAREFLRMLTCLRYDFNRYFYPANIKENTKSMRFLAERDCEYSNKPRAYQIGSRVSLMITARYPH